jgi:ribosomal protein S12 methylthiotransferase accessory factor YcaO
MGETELSYYILFHNYTQGLALHELLRGEGLKARIAPTPRSIQGELSCGMSLLVREADIAAVRECIERHHAEHHSIVELPCQINPNRGKFC